MQKSTLLINTRDRSELSRLIGAIGQLKKLNLPTVFVRQGDDAKTVTHELLADLQACGLAKDAYAAIPLVKKSLTTELSTRGLSIGMYLGKDINFLGKAAKALKVTEEKTISYRYATLCKDCEKVISENTYPVTKAEAEKKIAAFKIDDEVEIYTGDGTVNIIAYDSCTQC